MIDTRKVIYRKQYTQLRNFFIPLCIDSHTIYCFNILRIIKILYHFYIEHDIYDISYNKNINRLYKNIFIEDKINKWNDFITFDEEMRKMGLLKYVRLLQNK